MVFSIFMGMCHHHHAQTQNIFITFKRNLIPFSFKIFPLLTPFPALCNYQQALYRLYISRDLLFLTFIWIGSYSICICIWPFSLSILISLPVPLYPVMKILECDKQKKMKSTEGRGRSRALIFHQLTIYPLISGRGWSTKQARMGEDRKESEDLATNQQIWQTQTLVLPCLGKQYKLPTCFEFHFFQLQSYDFGYEF